MRKTKKHKEFIKQLKARNKCTVSPQDIYMNTDFFDKERKQQKTPYKLAFLVSLVFVAISITFISILSIKNYQLLTKDPEVIYIDKIQYMIDDTNGMPEDEKLKIKNSLDFFSFSPICTYAYNKNTIIYMYVGYTLNDVNKKTYYYYYAVNNNNKLYDQYKISIAGKTFKIEESNRYGLLTTIDENKGDSLVFSFIFEFKNSAKTYVLDASNY